MVTDGECTGVCTGLNKNAEVLREGDSQYVWAIGVGEANKTQLKVITGREKQTVYIKDYGKIKKIQEV